MGYGNPSYKNSDVVTGIDNFYTTSYNDSIKGIPHNPSVSNSQLTTILTDAKGDGRRSLAHDWLVPDPKGSGRKFSFATSYGIERPANMSEDEWDAMKADMDKLNPERSQIQKNYEAGRYNKEKGAVGGSSTHDSWVNDPAMDDILHNEEIKFFGKMVQSIADENVKRFEQNKKNERIADYFKMVSGLDIPDDQEEYNNALYSARTTIEGTDLVKQFKLMGEPGDGNVRVLGLTDATLDNLSSNIIDLLRIEPKLNGITHMTRDQAYEGEWDSESKTYIGGWKQLAEAQGKDSSKSVFDKEFSRDKFQIFESKEGSFIGAAKIDIKKHFKYDSKTKKWSIDENAAKEIEKSLAKYIMRVRGNQQYVHGFDNDLLNQNPTRIMQIATQLYNASNTAATTN